VLIEANRHFSAASIGGSSSRYVHMDQKGHFHGQNEL